MSENFDAHPEQVELAKVFSSIRLLGPPLGDQLVRLIAHLFTPEEAAVAKRLPFYYPKPAEKIARKAGRPASEISPLLDSMYDKRVVMKAMEGYALLPLIPGMFEYMLMDGRDSEWHREYARMLTEIYSTGYIKEYNQVRLPAIRPIPVQGAITPQSRVLDADLISEMIDAHQHFAMANVCQCRQSQHFTGHDCKRATPEDGCLVFGSFAEAAVQNNSARKISAEQMKDIVTERWEKKLVFMTGNVSPASPNAICTCCDCCCHALETVNHFDGQAVVAPPHFLARVDSGLCDNCGKCSRACNTYAHTWENKKHGFDVKKCIGCGLCVSVCKEGAISMVENPAYKPPSKGFGSLALRLLPGTVFSSIKVRLSK